MDTPATFADLPAEAFPVNIEFLAGDRVVHAVELSGPGALHIPPLKAEHGPVAVRIKYATGEEHFVPAPPC